ncbi:TIGR02536 family ethanolamine utilization protein [Brevibacillus daliensis]|uniref:TIGR02536 family ethanolamine utilization protein n=1 Tax=Brevibacillus daliensis TaxID=2892995 RepID=UPI001E33C4C5|nr:TIGR02536 family ethanolamine utilization protein [Brevibacillus daliensis]
MNGNLVHLEALIQAVTDEVYNKLKQQQAIKADRKKLVIMSGESESEIEAKLGKHFDIAYYNEQTRDCDVIVIPTICIQLLSNLANGISAGSRERFILTMLLKGKKVIALDEGLKYRKYKSTAPVLLYNMYTSYTEKIMNYGIQIIRESDLLHSCLQDGREAATAGATQSSIVETIQATSQPVEKVRAIEPDKQQVSQEILTKKVITEADLKKFYLKQISEIVIDKKSIITPLAQDYVRTQQMIVHRR